MGKVKKVVEVASKVVSKPVDAVQKDNNNLLLIVLIIAIWLYLFFTKE